MAGLKEIKQKIRSTARTRTVTKAMEAVSAAHMRRTQAAALGGRAYARAAASVLARAQGARDLVGHPLADAREVTRALYIVITSDKGLAGALNSAVMRATQQHMREYGLEASSASVIAIGRKAQEFFLRRGHAIEAYHPNTDDVSSGLIAEIVHEAARRFTVSSAERVDRVFISYQNFISTFEQRPTLRTLYPLSLEELRKVVDDIAPARGAQAHARTSDVLASNYSVEPGEAQILDAILQRLSAIFVYHALLESQASEHSARMVAMKGASDKAAELGDALTLRFNKARQAAITREVSEITGGMEAVS